MLSICACYDNDCPFPAITFGTGDESIRVDGVSRETWLMLAAACDPDTPNVRARWDDGTEIHATSSGVEFRALCDGAQHISIREVSMCRFLFERIAELQSPHSTTCISGALLSSYLFVEKQRSDSVSPYARVRVRVMSAETILLDVVVCNSTAADWTALSAAGEWAHRAFLCEGGTWLTISVADGVVRVSDLYCATHNITLLAARGAFTTAARLAARTADKWCAIVISASVVWPAWSPGITPRTYDLAAAMFGGLCRSARVDSAAYTHTEIDSALDAVCAHFRRQVDPRFAPFIIDAVEAFLQG